MLVSHVDWTTFMLYLSENTSTTPQNYLSQSKMKKKKFTWVKSKSNFQKYFK